MTLIVKPGFQWWDPSLISTALWFDASDSTTVFSDAGTTQAINNSSVQQWNDKSGNAGRNLSQLTSGQRPLYVANSLNEKPVLTFDGSNDYLFNASVGALGLTSVALFSVFRMITGGSTEDLPMGVGQTGIAGTIRAFYRGANVATAGFAGWSYDVLSSAYSYDIGGSYHIFEAYNTALSGSAPAVIGRDGSIASYTPSGAVTQYSSTDDGFSVGSLRGGLVGSYYSNISVAEIVVLYSAPSTNIRQRIEGYLAHKWGLTANLPSDHPYKTNAPAP
jgi:hypothetical protein